MKPKGPKPDSLRTAIEGSLRFVRGQKIILDRDMAEIYGVSVTTVNLALKRDVQHFPDELVFRLTHEESRSLKLPIATLNKTERSSKHLPFAFTERGLLMAESVLGSQSATNKHGGPIRQLVAALRQLADNFRKSDEFEAEERRRKRKEGRTRIRQIKLQMSSAAINDGLNDLKPGIIPARWWWLHSLEQWESFQDDPWAQGYELVRRSVEHRDLLTGTILGPYYSRIPKEKDPILRSWMKLSRGEREFFKSGFLEMLGNSGFQVSIGIRVSNKAIIFDCRWPLKRMISLLKSALESPTPFIIGRHLKGNGISKIFTRSLKKKPPAGSPKPSTSYIKSGKQFSNWNVIHKEHPEWIHLPLPCDIIDRNGAKRALNDKEILTIFETFIRKPPTEFRTYRAEQRRSHRRLDVPKPRTLALGMMARDYKLLSVSKLTDFIPWLLKLDPKLLRCLDLTSRTNSKRKAYTDLDYAQRKLEELLKRTVSAQNS